MIGLPTPPAPLKDEDNLIAGILDLYEKFENQGHRVDQLWLTQRSYEELLAFWEDPEIIMNRREGGWSLWGAEVHVSEYVRPGRAIVLNIAKDQARALEGALYGHRALIAGHSQVG